jgi:hypothetical protein
MQTFSATDAAYDIPPAFFPPEATEAPSTTLPRTAMALAFLDAMPAPLETVAAPAPATPLVTLRIARAITGETELRLYAQKVGDATTYIVRKSSIAPYKSVDTPLKGKKLTEPRAREAFEKLVAETYPAETLRNNKVVPIHLDLL